MNKYMCRVIAAMFLFLALGTASSAADEVQERGLLNEPRMQTAPLSPKTTITSPAPTLEQTVAMLQQQVQTLTAQVAALQSVLRVTPTGTVLQAPALALFSQEITVRVDKKITIDAGQTLDLTSAGTASLKAASGVIQTSGNLDLKGATIKHNGGGRRLALVGSTVGSGQVLDGSSTVLGN